jgi:putative ABC transport system ATP-binding protein
LPLSAEAGRLVADSVVLTYCSGTAEVRALQGVSFDFEPGAFVALIGPSGSGKTSLLHCLGGLVSPTSGEIRWDGRRLSGPELPSRIDARGAAFAYVFQGGNLMTTFTAAENIAFAAFVSGRRNEVDALGLLRGVGLEAKAHALPDELSGGEQQRVAMVRALAQGARVLLADEPTGQLDSTTARVVLDLIDSVRAERPELIVVLATHDLEVAKRAQLSIAIVDGRILQEASRR